MVDLAWAHAGPSILAAFLASTVEFVEALTVILAVGSVRNWRDTLLGAAVALGVLLLLVSIFGTALASVPLDVIQLAVGALLLLFGLRWLRKAILRSAGVIPLHDEAAVFAKQIEAMRGHGNTNGSIAKGWDRIAFGAAFQITMLEGTEVVFIVIAIGAGGTGLLLPASLGALTALLIVMILGLVVHRPLSRVPENSLKFIVGVLLSAFGSFWFGEGIGVAWPGSDWSILALIVGFLAVALLAVPLCRMRPGRGGAGVRV
ncbi:COG4280 domain-containing protein [Rhodopila sp.]|uniref:COG4280 domain-containing protein n=1 Tax=Rhodopila sp. TaxID=2480087 RepID=UPI003D0BB1AE